jgi:hypothetical protein
VERVVGDNGAEVKCYVGFFINMRGGGQRNCAFLICEYVNRDWVYRVYLRWGGGASKKWNRCFLCGACRD